MKLFLPPGCYFAPAGFCLFLKAAYLDPLPGRINVTEGLLIKHSVFPEYYPEDYLRGFIN